MNSAWKSSYEFQFRLILMSNYDHFWNIFKDFSHLPLSLLLLILFLILLLPRFVGYTCRRVVSTTMAPKMARMIIIVVKN